MKQLKTLGKSRLVVHSNKLLESSLPTKNPSFLVSPVEDKTANFNEIFGGIGRIFIDFSREDSFSDRDFGLDISHSLGLRIAAHFFFGIGFNHFIGTYILTDFEKKLFTFENVCSLISERYCKSSGKHLLLLVQLDEFAHVGYKEKLNDMLNLFSTHMSTKHSQLLCIHPQLTGTDTDSGIQAITLSRMNSTPLLLEPLSKLEE